MPSRPSATGRPHLLRSRKIDARGPNSSIDRLRDIGHHRALLPPADGFSAAPEDPMLRASQLAAALRATIERSHRPGDWRLVAVCASYRVLGTKRPSSNFGTRLTPQ